MSPTVKKIASLVALLLALWRTRRPSPSCLPATAA